MRRLLRPALTTSIFALFLAMGLALSPRSQAPTAEAAHTDGVVHVHPTLGDDTDPETRGTEADPFLTIQAAIDHAATTETIQLEGPFTESVAITGGKVLLFRGVGLSASSDTLLSITTGAADGAQVMLNQDDELDGFIAGFAFFTSASSGMTVAASGGTFTITSNAGTVDVRDPFSIPRVMLTAPQSTTITPPVTAPDVFVVTRSDAGLLAPLDNDSLGAGPYFAFQLGTVPSTPEHATSFTLQADGVTYQYVNDGSGYPADRFFYQAFDPFGSDNSEQATIFIAPQIPPEPNPALAASCGLDIVLVMDSSDSIDGSDSTTPTPSPSGTQFEQLQQALIDFVNAFLPGTATQFALVEFNTQAIARPFGTDVFSGDAAAIIGEIGGPREQNAAVDGIGAGFTNYDDAFNVAHLTFGNAANRPDRPDLMVFASDGVPTVMGQPGEPVSSAEGDLSAASQNAWVIELEQGIVHANQAKLDGVRILAFGIDIAAQDAAASGAVTFALEQVSSQGAVTTSGFDTFSQDLRELATSLCGGTVTVHKLIDADGNPGTTGDQTPADATTPFTFDATTSQGQLQDAQLGTGSDGAAVFEIDNLSGTASVGITEQGQPIAASCEADGAPTGTFAGSAVTGIEVGPDDIVTCTFVNAAGPAPTGKLEVTKRFVDDTLLPVTSPTAQITMDGANVGSPVGDGGSVQMDFPDGAAVLVFEDLAGLPGDYSQSFECGDGDIALGVGGFSVDIAGETTASCRLTNTRQAAALTVSKDTDPDDDSEWAITVDGVSAGSALQDDGVDNGDSLTVSVPAGVALSVVEAGLGGPTQDGAYSAAYECDDPATTSGSGSTINLPALADGANVTCTFTNTLSVTPPLFSKTFEPDTIGVGATSTLTFLIDNRGNAVAATNLDFTDNLPAGVVIADAPGLSTTCNGALPSGVATGTTVSFSGGSVPAGIICNVRVVVTSATPGDYLNTSGDLTSSLGNSGPASDTLAVEAAPKGSIVVTKNFVDGTDAPQSNPAVGITIEGSTLNLIEDGESTLEQFFDEGTTVSISETGQGGADLRQYAQALACSDSGGTVPVTSVSGGFEVTLGAERVDCTLTNRRRAAILRIEKDVVPDDATQWRILVDGAHLDTLGDGGSSVFTLPAGVQLAISEESQDTAVAGQYAASFSCADGPSGAADSFDITLAEGGDVTCRFTNTLNVVVDLAISKDDGGATASPGDTIVYVLGYENHSNVTTTGVTITDVVPANTSFYAAASTGGWICAPDSGAGSSCTIEIGSAAAGASGSIDFAVTVDDPTAATQIGNTAEIADDGSSGADVNPANNTASDATPVIQAGAPPAFAKSFAPDRITAGGTSTLTFTIDNSANAGAATALDFTDTLPAAVVIASPANAGTTCTGGTLTAAASGSTISYSGGAVAAGAACTIGVDVTSSTAGTHSNVSADLTSSAGNSGNATDDLKVDAVVFAADLSITKHDDIDPIAPGGTLTYTVEVSNAGPDTAEHVVTSDTLPAGVTFVGSSGCAEDPNGVPSCSLGSIASGGSVQFTVTVTVDAGTGGTITNVVSVSSDTADPNAANNSASEDTKLNAPPPQTAPAVDIRKQAEGPDSRTVTSGSDVSFQIVVTNSGDTILADLVVTDPLVPDCERAVHGQHVGLLLVGESASYSCTATNVTAGFTNVATVTAFEKHTTNKVSDSDPSTVEVEVEAPPAGPAIDLQKTPDTQTIEPGGLAEFTIIVTNVGELPLLNVQVTDALAPDCDFPIGSLAVAESVQYGCSIEGVQASFTNVAVVVGEVSGSEGDTVTDNDSALVQVGSTPPPPVVQAAAAPPPPPITITVVKAVTTSGIGRAPADGSEFAFELDCVGPDFSFSLADGESFQASMAANTRCSLTETDSRGASSVSGEFSDQLLGGSQTFTVTNNYHLDEPVVLGSAITKTLTSADPAAVGEGVQFDVAVTFEGDVMPNAELVDSYDPRYLEFVSASVAGAALGCSGFEAGPTLTVVVCGLGDALGPFTVTTRFVAVASTVPGTTTNTAEVSYDPDGNGPLPRQRIGPVSDDVQIVEVLALPPLGDDAPVAAGGLAALIGAGVAAALGARMAMRRRRRTGRRAA